MPSTVEGRNYLARVGFKNTSPEAAWYVGLFEGDYTPTGNETAATVAALATECTANQAATRVQAVFGTPANGVVDNSASLAEFVMTADKTVHGAFLISASAKGATTGVLAQIVRFPSPKVQSVGSKLSVLVGPTIEPKT